MEVNLIHHTPLRVADMAIGKCWDKPTPNNGVNVERIDRVANKNKHASTIEHITYNLEIVGVSRALLQELARHRMANISVKSTRYTLKELKDEKPFGFAYTVDGYIVINEEDIERAKSYIVFTGEEQVDLSSIVALENLRTTIAKGIANDKAKYCLPEAYKTELTWTCNARAMQNFLSLRTSKAAMWEIRDLAYEIFKALPEDHKFLFEHCVES